MTDKVEQMKLSEKKKMKIEKMSKLMKSKSKGEYKQKKGNMNVYLKKDSWWDKLKKNMIYLFFWCSKLPIWETFLNVLGCDLVFYLYVGK